MITGGKRPSSVTATSGASKHQGLTLRDDELDLLGMIFPLSNLSKVNIFAQIHILLPINGSQ